MEIQSKTLDFNLCQFYVFNDITTTFPEYIAARPQICKIVIRKLSNVLCKLQKHGFKNAKALHVFGIMLEDLGHHNMYTRDDVINAFAEEIQNLRFLDLRDARGNMPRARRFCRAMSGVCRELHIITNGRFRVVT